MEELLRPASTVRLKSVEAEGNFLRESKPTDSQLEPSASQKPRGRVPITTEEALEILKGEPDYDTLTSTLDFLHRHSTERPPIPDIILPRPLNSQIVQVLVTEIIPNYWALLLEDAKPDGSSTLGRLLTCLVSTTGINAILVRMRALIQEAKSEAATKIKRPDIVLNLRIVTELLCRLIQDPGVVVNIYELYERGLQSKKEALMKKTLLHEVVAALGSGRIVSIVAEAEDIIKSNGASKEVNDFWPADPVRYTEWLGRCLIRLALSSSTTEATRFGADLLAKALRLGHLDKLVWQLVLGLILDAQQNANSKGFGRFFECLPSSDQRKVLNSVLKMLSSDSLDRLGRCESEESSKIISAAAGVVKAAIGPSENVKKHLVDWLTSSSGAGLGDGIGIRRAVMAVVSQHRDDLMSVFEKSLAQFGDQLYIKHSPVLQQEAHAQVLLLAAGYIHRTSPVKLAMALRSSAWMNAISNRLAATNQRVRFLGILVGEALSGLVDKEDKRLNFKMEETEQAEGKWYKGLVRVSDDVGPLGPLQRLSSNQPQPKPQPQQKPQKPTPKPAPQRQQQPKSGLIIEELSDGEPPEEDDIVPYAKPDSDPEDSDDDPTLIRRDKPKAPVYIRELIRYLRDSDNYDHQKLALTTAPTLIRRKADYGTEVAEHAEEIASLLVGLSDKFKMESFDQMRLQGMIALVVAKPEKMGPWFAKTFFEGDYSISQRASILAVLGMGARELAGLETSNYASAAAFPSKTLPERVERLYLEHNTLPSGTQSNSLKSLPKNALENITSSLTDAWLAPLAAKAADAATGPDVLKLSTFSSRLNKQQDSANNQQQQALLENPKTKYTTKSRPRQRAIPNTTAHLIATSFFSPLIARFQAALHSTTSSAISSARFHTAVSHPHLLSLYLQTLALLLHAAGPGTLALPSMTAELWRLLLGARVRAAAVGDLAVTRAVLFGFLALLDVNEDRARDVCAELGREVVEAMEWVGAVFGGLRGGDEAGEEEGVKALAAGVLVRLKEAVEKYQLVMVGDLIGFG